MTRWVTDYTVHGYRQKCPTSNIENAAKNGKALNRIVAEWMDSKQNNYPLFTWAWLTRERLDRIAGAENMKPYATGSKLTEITVYSMVNNRVVLTGKVDAVLQINGKPAIVETKNIATVPRDDGDEALQASIYQYLWNRLFPDNQIEQVYLLWIPLKDTPRLIPVKKQPEELLERIARGEDI